MSANRSGVKPVSRPRAVAYAVVAVVLGVVVGELVAMLVFAGASDRRLDEQAARNADGSPAVVAATADLQRARQARTALDTAVVEASQRRDEALVVARCEFNPSPACPQTRITGVPGAGPENHTANGFLADTQQQLDKAVALRDRLAPSLDAAIADGQATVTEARAAVASPDRGFGARWLAMNSYTLDSAGATVLRALLTGLFVVAFLFPLLLRLSRASTKDRRSAARAVQERADLDADTAIAVKRAQVRAAIETMKAEQELASARLQIEAQHEIEREQQRRRIVAAVAPVAPVAEVPAVEPDHLPALPPAAAAEVAPAAGKGVAIPDAGIQVAKAATRWIRPFVPPIVASALETTTRLRGVRQVFEETEEIHLSLRRSHRVAVASEAEPEAQREIGQRELPSAAKAIAQNATSSSSTSPTKS